MIRSKRASHRMSLFLSVSYHVSEPHDLAGLIRIGRNNIAVSRVGKGVIHETNREDRETFMRSTWKTSTSITLRLVATLFLLLAGVVGAATSASAQRGSSDIAIVTTENGHPVYDACYVLVDFSEVGCDENGDGKITFEDVPFGSYTVTQVADLGPYRSVSDFRITVTGDASGDGWERFPAFVTTTSGAPGGAIDIALITRDPEDGHLLTGTCYVLVGYSNEGCDETGDGQVTFAEIPYGTYTVTQTRTPKGYPAINDYEIDVQPLGYWDGPEYNVPLGFIVKQARQQNAPDTRNVSVVFVDMYTHEKIDTGICVELVGASNVGCDEGLVDGQVDFLDVVAGGPYELRFSNLPSGAINGGPLTVTIEAERGDPANRFVLVPLSLRG